MTNEQLITDLRLQFPTFTIVQNEELIRVEMPKPFKSPAWVRLFEDKGEVYAGPTQESVRGDMSHKIGRVVFKIDRIGEALWHIAHDRRQGCFVLLPEHIAPLIGGPFDQTARVLAQTGAKAAQSLASALQMLATKERAQADRAQERADDEAAHVLAFTKILETQ
jgi:hypothetical protein